MTESKKNTYYGWIKHVPNGDVPPVPADTEVYYKCRAVWNTKEAYEGGPTTAGRLRWDVTDRSGDIMEYRIVPPPDVFLLHDYPVNVGDTVYWATALKGTSYTVTKVSADSIELDDKYTVSADCDTILLWTSLDACKIKPEVIKESKYVVIPPNDSEGAYVTDIYFTDEEMENLRLQPCYEGFIFRKIPETTRIRTAK